MRRHAFEAMVREMAAQLPPEFLAGVVDIEVTGKTVPHPLRDGVWTLGECVPHAYTAETDDESHALRSTIYLHYGSFAALAACETAFDWNHETWETLTHELRHHLEWRARASQLEAFDDAVEANYARQEGEPFPPLFFLDGDRLAPGVTKVEDDVFIDCPLGARAFTRAPGSVLPVAWHGRSWTLRLPERLPDILFVTLTGVSPEPAGDLVVVVRRKAGLRDLFRRPAVQGMELPVEG